MHEKKYTDAETQEVKVPHEQLSVQAVQEIAIECFC